MSVATMNDPFHIDAPSHWRRNLWLLTAVLAASAAITGYYVAYTRSSAIEMNRLERFRAAVAEKCESPGFAEVAPPVLKDMYLSSTALRDAVDRQQAALDAGADCESIFKALRAADFPLPAQPAPTPTIRLQTSQAE
jgi:hypothetical protein